MPADGEFCAAVGLGTIAARRPQVDSALLSDELVWGLYRRGRELSGQDCTERAVHRRCGCRGCFGSAAGGESGAEIYVLSGGEGIRPQMELG